MEKGKFIINVDSLITDFQKHLDKNDRCIFSGRFGSGKSFFLNHFINLPEVQDEYVFIPIYPVNYQITGELDVFECLKRDILLKLVSNHYDSIDTSTISNSWKIASFLKTRGVDLIKDVGNILPDLNIPGLSLNTPGLFKGLNRVRKLWDDHIQEVTKGVENVEDYEVDFSDDDGSIYEFNPISQLIYDIIDSMKKRLQNQNRKVVLILEDLDRMAPECIFRILNIFSAHDDSLTPGKNKFGFDKIILVCDIDNIKNIYRHRYGAEVDFSGYIDKFYSSTIYYFDNADIVINQLLDLYKRVYSDVNNYPDYQYICQDKRSALAVILKDLIRYRIINMRNLIMVSDWGVLKHNAGKPYIYDVFDFLCLLFGSIEMMREGINRLAKISTVLPKGEEIEQLIISTVQVANGCPQVGPNKTEFKVDDAESIFYVPMVQSSDNNNGLATRIEFKNPNRSVINIIPLIKKSFDYYYKDKTGKNNIEN
ncbi:P-loop NTPase fold protein [Bacteroides sp.]|uniref:P-loop NTPase fold protein n=1 Tax=Bacteroides sp. TaxID=29523 RepID=UPI002584D011|nr:P-loop NTPase fold protein [Bacteroides sp.]